MTNDQLHAEIDPIERALGGRQVLITPLAVGIYGKRLSHASAELSEHAEQPISP